jgi:hypothetical protein
MVTGKPSKATIKKEENQAAFLAAFAKSGHFGNSALAAHIDRSHVYDWRNDPAFEARFQIARKQSVTVLEDEAHRRAYTGVDEPVFYRGEECGTVRKYSDTLLIFLLKGNDPVKYRDNNQLEVTGAGGEPLFAGLLTRLKGYKDTETTKE